MNKEKLGKDVYDDKRKKEREKERENKKEKLGDEE